MPDLTPETITELRELHAACRAATEGTWITSGSDPWPFVKAMWNDDGGGDCDITGGINREDAELIAAAVNALPAILDALEQARATIANYLTEAAEYAPIVRRGLALDDADVSNCGDIECPGCKYDADQDRADQAEATVARVQSLADEDSLPADPDEFLRRLRAALDPNGNQP